MQGNAVAAFGGQLACLSISLALACVGLRSSAQPPPPSMPKPLPSPHIAPIPHAPPRRLRILYSLINLQKLLFFVI